jgi:hypothetical protein
MYVTYLKEMLQQKEVRKAGSNGSFDIFGREVTHILALLINSSEAGNLLRGNGALHAMLDARTRVCVQLMLVTRMSICLIARLLVQATPQSR